HARLHSFPTRRSSDLSGGALHDASKLFEVAGPVEGGKERGRGRSEAPGRTIRAVHFTQDTRRQRRDVFWAIAQRGQVDSRRAKRSEEHTSELQSRGHL